MHLPSKNAVRRAGKNAAKSGSLNAVSQGDVELLDEWRKAHLQPLSAVAMWLRKPSLDATGLAPAQRLKRRETFLDKLITGRSQDASTMHDLGGCRLIFPDVAALQDFRTYLDSESRARHQLTHERNKYDYISSPKPTGYRGVHYVYGYSSSSKARADLDGLKIEVQLRTSVQHAWATAVEIADLVSDTRTKFEDGSGDYGQFFRLASELLARFHEGMPSCASDLSLQEVKDRFHKLEEKIGLLDRLAKLREQGDIAKIKQHTVLAFREDDTVEIFGYTKASRAVARERELLTDATCVNVVYVSASTPRSIRSSYRNYLTNPEDFVELLREALTT